MFEGYTPETIDFLWGIRMNNYREWFQAHKTQYVNTLYEPTKALGAELFRLFVDKPGTILKVSRIYKDARMHPEVPYKESLWICVRQAVDWWAENPCLFFEICPDGASYGFSLWHPRPGIMERFRREIVAEPDTFLSLLESTQRSVGMTVTAQCYKRPQQPEDPRLAPYFAWKNDIDCIRHEEVSPELFGPALADRVSEFFTGLIPLYDYFCRICSAEA